MHQPHGNPSPGASRKNARLGAQSLGAVDIPEPFAVIRRGGIVFQAYVVLGNWVSADLARTFVEADAKLQGSSMLIAEPGGKIVRGHEGWRDGAAGPRTDGPLLI